MAEPSCALKHCYPRHANCSKVEQESSGDRVAVAPVLLIDLCSLVRRILGLLIGVLAVTVLAHEVRRDGIGDRGVVAKVEAKAHYELMISRTESLRSPELTMSL